MERRVDKSFLGRGWAFPPQFQQHNRQTIMVEHDADIKESLRILLATRPGERVMQPEFGCALHALVFETLDARTITEIRRAVEQAILFFEPRITLTGIDVDAKDALEGIVLIEISYIVRSTNSRSNIVYPFYLQQGTHVRV